MLSSMSNAGWIPFKKAGLGYGLHPVQESARRQDSIINVQAYTKAGRIAYVIGCKKPIENENFRITGIRKR